MLLRLTILFSILAPLSLRAQHLFDIPSGDTRHAALFIISKSDSAYTLPHTFVVPGSEKVLFDSTRTLRRGTDYEIQYYGGTIWLRRAFRSEIPGDSSTHRITISYDTPPYSLLREYSLHRVTSLRDSSGATIGKVEPTLSRFSMDDVFGSGLQKSGSIFRGLTVGSNRDLTVNSGFRMQLAGKLSSDLDIAATLTDENVPIQPEGTTQTLQELDKVFIQLKNPRYSATLGDFVYEVREQQAGEFGRVSRKLQGANGTAMLGNAFGEGSSLSVGLTAATARGKYTTNQLQGIEGTQGPYLLTGQDAAVRPIIIAGTERVYVDGQLLTRGETNDYTIDYSTGELYFSAKRLITNATRITVDFEYTDRQFARNLVGFSAAATAMDNMLHVFTAVTQEADDPSTPIDVALNDSLRAIISASGSDKFKASISGITLAGRDSITQRAIGQYIVEDTLINGRRRSLLVYAPGDQRALYSVTFNAVPAMPPDSLGYNRSNAGGYVVAGLGKGSYLPVQFLPVPELHRFASGRVSFSPRGDITLNADYALSSHDQNRLSSLDDGSNNGGAYKLNAEYHPRNLMIGSMNLGELGVSLSDRFVDHRFVSLDRIDEIEFNRNWNISSASSGDESIRQAAVTYMPVQRVELAATYGSLERQGSVRSSRTTTNVVVADSSLPTLHYGSEYIHSDDLGLSSNSDWLRQNGTIVMSFRNLAPSFRISMEDRRNRTTISDSLQPGSFRFLEFAPSVSLVNLEPLSASAEVQWRTEDSASGGGLARAFNALTQLYELHLREWRSFSSSVSLSLRRTELTDEFAARGGVAANTMLVRSQFRYAPLQRAVDADVLYEFARERSAAMKRVFVRVPIGTGNYKYLGDLNQNGIADDSEFEQTRFDGEYIAIYVPSDQFIPVADLRTGLRLRLSPAKIIARRTSFIEKGLAAISTETVVRIEEKNTDPDPSEIYLLHLSRFLNDSTTITGSNLFTQDLYLFESDPTFSLRYRFNQREGLLRLVGSIERSALRERSVRVRTQLLKEIGNQTEYTNKTDQLTSSVDSPRERDLHSDELKTEFSYRPYPEWEVAFGFGASQIVNRFGGGNATANLDNEFLHLTYAMASLGQLRGEFTRENVRVANPPASSSEYPYEFTNGGVVGKTFLWRLAFDYRISQFVQVTVNYDGRSEGGRPVVHTARAEARAFF